MTQFASTMIAFASSALTINLSVEGGISYSYDHYDFKDLWRTAGPSIDASGTWHIAGPFGEEIICDWDQGTSSSKGK